jgi:hypothetical protein
VGHENSALSLFVTTELDPRGGLSHLEPGVNIWKLVRVPRVSYYDLINGFDHGQLESDFKGPVDPKSGPF